MKKWGLFVTLIGLLGVVQVLWNPGTLYAQDVYHVAFVSNRDGNDEIYIADLDGSNPVNLTQSRSRDWHPDWSPDGQRIVFASDRDNNQELYLMQNNGSDVTNLTQNAANDNSPAWSPDGHYIVFGSDRDGGQDLYLIEVETGEVTRLTTDGIVKSAPAWSPDSSEVVYWQTVNEVALIFVVTVATGETRAITSDGPDNWPVWSPEGTYIAFENAASGQPDIFTINLADNTITNLTDDPASDIRPAWSPDGSQIIFASNRGGNYDLYVMDADGSTPSPVLSMNGDENSPVWQPVPAPVDLSNTSGVVVQSYTAIGADALASALTDQKVLGGGDMRLLAPESMGVNEVIQVRLEVELLEVMSGDATPAPSPTPETGELRESTYLDQVYAIMGAELRGVDIDRFKIDPMPTDYVLRLRADAVNYWEWTLRPKGNESLGTSFLAVSLYAPELLEDGSIVKTVIQDVRFEVEVISVPGAAVIPPTPTPVVEVRAAPVEEAATLEAEVILQSVAAAPAPASFAVLYSNRDSLTVVVYQETNVDDLTISSARGEEWVDTFDIMSALSYTVTPGMCFQYVRYEAAPPIPRDCDPQSTFKLVLDPIDIFWYDPVEAKYLGTVLKKGQNMLGVCAGGETPCNFNVQ